MSVIPNDVIRLASEQAAQRFGGSDGTFNAAGFAQAMSGISATRQLLDGNMVRALLAGRADVAPLSGGCHYQLSQ